MLDQETTVGRHPPSQVGDDRAFSRFTLDVENEVLAEALRDGLPRRIRLRTKYEDAKAKVMLRKKDLSQVMWDIAEGLLPSKADVTAAHSEGIMWLTGTGLLGTFSAFLIRWRLLGFDTNPAGVFASGFALMLLVAGLLLLGPLQGLRVVSVSDLNPKEPRWLRGAIWLFLIVALLLFAALGVVEFLWQPGELGTFVDAASAARWTTWSRGLLAGALGALLLGTELVLAVSAGRTFVWIRYVRPWRKKHQEVEAIEGNLAELSVRMETLKALIHEMEAK